MKIDLCKYYDLDEVESWIGANGDQLYTIFLISKSTGEIIDLTFTEDLFDEILKEMEEEVDSLSEQWYFLGEPVL